MKPEKKEQVRRVEQLKMVQTVDGKKEIYTNNQLRLQVGSLFHYLQAFIHSRWCRVLPSTVPSLSFNDSMVSVIHQNKIIMLGQPGYKQTAFWYLGSTHVALG